MSKILLFVAIVSFIYFEGLRCESTEKTESEENSTEASNDTVPEDLYIIKTVVYEVGILTDAANDTDNSTETDDEVNISFFNPTINGTAIDLSHIPVPIQTNVSGVTVTGILPGADLASVLLPPKDQKAPLTAVLPTKEVTVTQNFSTSNPKEGSEIISNLPKILGLATDDSNKTKESVKETETSTEKKDKE